MRIAFVLLAAAAAAHAAGDGLDDLMQALAARRHGEVSFVERQYLSILKKPLESSGELLYDAPDRLEKRTLAPKHESLMLRGHTLTVERGNRSHTLDLTSYPQALPFVESIRATLAGDRAALERQFKLQFSGGAEHWTLVLVPLDREAEKAVSEVRIEGAKSDLVSVEIRRPGGDRSLMTLHALAEP